VRQTNLYPKGALSLHKAEESFLSDHERELWMFQASDHHAVESADWPAVPRSLCFTLAPPSACTYPTPYSLHVSCDTTTFLSSNTLPLYLRPNCVVSAPGLYVLSGCIFLYFTLYPLTIQHHVHALMPQRVHWLSIRRLLFSRLSATYSPLPFWAKIRHPPPHFSVLRFIRHLSIPVPPAAGAASPSLLCSQLFLSLILPFV
jgi:hypothetical protein